MEYRDDDFGDVGSVTYLLLQNMRRARDRKEHVSLDRDWAQWTKDRQPGGPEYEHTQSIADAYWNRKGQ